MKLCAHQHLNRVGNIQTTPPIRPSKVTQDKIDEINRQVSVVRSKIRAKQSSNQRSIQPKEPTLEEQIYNNFYLNLHEVDHAIDTYKKLTEDEKKIWNKTEIDKINSIDRIKNLQDLSEETLDIIHNGTISPVAQEYMLSMFKSRVEVPENMQEEFSGGRRRRNKKRSIIRKKKRGKKTRKYRNKY